MESDREATGDAGSFEVLEGYERDDEGVVYNKTCKKCGIVKALSEFHRDAQNLDGHKTTCKDCVSPKKSSVSNDMIQNALDNAAYRLLKERLG